MMGTNERLRKSLPPLAIAVKQIILDRSTHHFFL